MRKPILLACSTVAVASLFLSVGIQIRADVVVDGEGTFVSLFAIETNDDGVIFVVREPSGLCGPPYHVERFGESPALLALIRDPGGHPCRGKLQIFARIAISYDELGLAIGDRFQVLNSIEANTVPFTPPRGVSPGLQRSLSSEH
jgi:hypothetical protein